MKAGILKKKLSNIPDDATVIVENDSCYEDGDYIATKVKYWKEENQNSEEILYVNIEHKNDDGVLEMFGAVFTGLSLYLIPTSASSDVIITITSSKGISNIYKGEMIVSQGFVGDILIDSNKYIKDEPQNLLKNSIKNAFDEYNNIYMNNFNKDERLK